MKELSIEEKAKRYDEAIEKAKNYHSPETACNVRIAMENLFSELKESEDERIRKKVIDILKLNVRGAESQMQASRGVDRTFEVYACNKVIVWLEKQGEQKPLFKKGDTVIWDGEEFDILDVTKDSYNVGGYIIPIYRQNELLLKQKPAWSEEDEQTFIESVEALEDFGKFELADWLKEHKNQVLPQPKQEWSEEDEQYIIDTINLLSFGCSSHSVGEVKDFLNSLKDRYTWKPSDEQINTLWDAIVYVEGCDSNFKGSGSVLENLYNDLKKLKG